MRLIEDSNSREAWRGWDEEDEGFRGGGGGRGSEERDDPCLDNHRVSSWFPEGGLRKAAEIVETGSALSLSTDILATVAKGGFRTGVGRDTISTRWRQSPAARLPELAARHHPGVPLPRVARGTHP